MRSSKGSKTILKTLVRAINDAMEEFPVEVKTKFSSQVYVIKPAPPMAETLAIIFHLKEVPNVVKAHFMGSGRVKEYYVYDSGVLDKIKCDLKEHVRPFI